MSKSHCKDVCILINYNFRKTVAVQNVIAEEKSTNLTLQFVSHRKYADSYSEQTTKKKNVGCSHEQI